MHVSFANYFQSTINHWRGGWLSSADVAKVPIKLHDPLVNPSALGQFGDRPHAGVEDLAAGVLAGKRMWLMYIFS